MAEEPNQQSQSINLNEAVNSGDFASGTDELTEPQKAKIKMTYWVLIGTALMLAASACAHIFVASEAAKEVFEFCKSFIPPIVTLVLGAHYVTRASS